MITVLPPTLRGTIHVPADKRAIRIDCLLLSSRVDAVLAREGYRSVGDLDGLTFGLLARHPGLGHRGLAELRAQLAGLGAVEGPTHAGSGPAPDARNPKDQEEARVLARRRRTSRVRVPPTCRDLLFESFPLSTRLTNALHASGWRRLGDLDGLRMEYIADRYGFGVLTLAELYDFLASQGAIEERAL